MLAARAGRTAACAIPRAAFDALPENRFQAIYCMTLTASRWRARPPLPVLVLDDNWPSRRTAESLGARVTGNFVTYRREL